MRMIVLILGTILSSYLMGLSLYVKPKDRLMVYGRAVIGTIGFTCGVIAAPMISVLIWNTLHNTVPFITALLGCVVLGERMNGIEIFALFVSFSGILCIAVGGSEEENTPINRSEDLSSNNQTPKVQWSHLLGCFLVLMLALAYAAGMIIVRKMQQINFAAMLFYEGVLATPSLLLLILSLNYIKEEPISLFAYSYTQYGWLLLTSIINFLATSTLVIAG